MHILVVEDEQRLAYLLRRVLLEERHTVDLAHDGHTGLDLALSDTYDAVILDLMLPGIDAVWRYDLDALSNVVDIYIHYLRDKIDQGFAHPLIKTVRGVGYKIEASNHP